MKAWEVEGFIATMRTGVTPFGEELDNDEMPWESIGKLDDEALTALYEFVRTVP